MLKQLLTEQNQIKFSHLKMYKYVSVFAGVGLILSSLLGTNIYASSHREAPTIASDPKADNTDVYAFVSPDKANTVTLIANFLPFEEPAGGPNFYRFDDNVLYEIKVDNVGDAKEHVTYQFRFKTTIKNKNTFLYNTGPILSLDDKNYNMAQTYTVIKVTNGRSEVVGRDIPVPPDNIGPKSTPNYANLQAQSIKTLSDGTTVFAGQSDDPFFAELGGLFDLLTIRKLPGNAGGGVDGLKGYNVNSIAIQVPTNQLTKNGSTPTDPKDKASIIGVWSTASRHKLKVLKENGDTDANGPFVQVSRLGAPLVNEVVIPLKDKDKWNGSKPKNDAQFAEYVANPELGGLLKSLYNVNVPPQGAFGSATQRDDLIAIFLTGIPGLTQPDKVKPSEELRLNVAVPPTQNRNRLGVLSGDKQGFPNGRRLADDVVDIEIQAVAGAAYPLFHPGYTPDPLATQLGDGVDANDVPFRTSFPYLALPHDGFSSVPHGTTADTATTPTSPVSSNQKADALKQLEDQGNAFNSEFKKNQDDLNNQFNQAKNEVNANPQNSKSVFEKLGTALDSFNKSINQARETFNNKYNELKTTLLQN
ncbi:MAG: DUF4331 family protein [Candidatus Levyibacteriota bacterium]